MAAPHDAQNMPAAGVDSRFVFDSSVCSCRVPRFCRITANAITTATITMPAAAPKKVKLPPLPGILAVVMLSVDN
jgi:hypothetical protein